MRTLGCGLFLLGLLLVAPALQAKTFTFDQLDIRCEVPDTWTFNGHTNFLVDVTDFTGQKHFILWAARSAPTDDLNSARYRLHFEQTFIAKGFNVVGRQMVLLHQVPFYKLSMTKDLGNKTLDATAYLGITSPYAYGINVGEYNSDPDSDKDLGDIVASIAFLRPPLLPSHNPFVRLFTPTDGLPHDAAYLFGYRLAILLIFLIMLLVPVLVLGAIGVGIYFLARSKPVPPPPPGPYPPS
jgi:hypothetical protein